FRTLGLYLTPSMSARAMTLVLLSALAVLAPTDVVRLCLLSIGYMNGCLGSLCARVSGRAERHAVVHPRGVNFALTFYPIDIATVVILPVPPSPRISLLFSSLPLVSLFSFLGTKIRQRLPCPCL
ncbi:hypothetical protein B0H13DRAFT_2140689, partial [Mycena leptocephala]